MNTNSISEKIKQLIRTKWILRFVLFPFVRPKRFMDEFVWALCDFWTFRSSIKNYLSFLRRDPPSAENKPGLLIVAGRGMNTQWCQLWAVLGAVFANRTHRVFVLTSRNQPMLNLYFRIFGFDFIFLEDLKISTVIVPQSALDQINGLESFMDFKTFKLDGAPLGSMAMSTYSRTKVTGVIDIQDAQTREEVRAWLVFIYQSVVASKQLYQKNNIDMLFFTEVFMEEYGAFYYGALDMGLNVIRFAGTVRDNAVIVQHLTKESDRTHHAAVTSQSWSQIVDAPDSKQIDLELERNFLDRYGDVWAMSTRNQPNTKIVDPKVARAELGIPSDRKMGVIFSHILYDTLFFIGEDLFPSYADWFVESVKAACANPNIEWFVKVHPSNLWRGELEQFFGGKYEEVRLIERFVGPLPKHVHMVYPDTPYSPYTWLQMTDYGITVRGTSGIELGALGKTVITAGSGRYEKIGFTVNPRTSAEYMELLKSLPKAPEPSIEQKRLGVKFAYMTFCMKPFTLDFLKPVPKFGKTRIFGTDDLVYRGNFPESMTELPASVERFFRWSFNKESVDFLNDWPVQPKEFHHGAVSTSNL
ncbi:MAG: hypothetical protein COT73_00395 [Bdellovibrio sp. CG10_big_fil_rev_8_21_14_0_10_47_8]|nr:MAG: hypothetical protein COT73_00395 [Bdellovibrio sp. CG10_big_fil_rev_8_21_14_0_10_47_8]